MKNIKNFIILAILFSTGSTWAVENCDEETDECLKYEELVVTAFRTPTQTDAIGSAYSIITSDDIKNRGTVTVSDLLRTVPGIGIDRSGPVGTITALRMRGGEGNHTLVIIDGIEVNDQSQDDSFNFGELLTTEIERIEIIRGAQSALWGSDALSGVINIITKKGSGKTSIRTNLEAGSFNTKKIDSSLSGGTKLYDYKFSASKFNTEGTNIRLDRAKDVIDRDGYDNNRLSFNGSIRPDSNLELKSSIIHTNSTNEFDGCFLGNTESDICKSNNSYTYGSLKLKHDVFNHAWQNGLTTTFKLINHDAFAKNSHTNGSSAKEYKIGLQSSVFFDTPEFLDANHTFTLAYEFETIDFQATNEAAFGAPDSTDLGNSINSYIAEYRVSFLNRLHLSVSGRHDDQSLHDDFTTYRNTVAFVIPKLESRLHASVGTGVKNPLFTEIDSSFGTFLSNANLIPEESKSWDIGIEQSFFKDRININATYFEERLENEILTVRTNPGNINTARNAAGTSERRGYELSFATNITDKTVMTGSYTYTDSIQDQNDTGVQTREIRRPPIIASLNLNHRFYNDRANLNAGVYYHGEDLDNTFPSPTFTATPTKVDQYTLVNISGSFELNKYIGLYAKIDNLTNQVYQSPISFYSSGIAAFAGIKIDMDGIVD